MSTAPQPAIPSASGGVDAIAALTLAGTFAKIEHIGTEGLGPGLPPTIPLVIPPGKDGKPASLADLVEKHRLAPARRTGTANTTTLASFIDLVNRHKDDDSAVFAVTALPTPALTAVIDYHIWPGDEMRGDTVGPAAHGPRHCQHRIAYAFPLTEEAKAWLGQDGKPMAQEAFAAWLEEHAAELAAPSPQETETYQTLFGEKFAAPNDLIALSRSLEVHVGQKVKQGARTKSGERSLVFTEEHTNAAGEAVDIPGLFMVAVQAFADGSVIRIPARLRYRLPPSGIVWHYQLYRAAHWLRAEIQADCARVAEATGLPVYEGTPEA